MGKWNERGDEPLLLLFLIWLLELDDAVLYPEPDDVEVEALLDMVDMVRGRKESICVQNLGLLL